MEERRCSPHRTAIEELVYRSCLALDEKNFKAYLDLCDADFRYTITAHSPEIRKDMIWLDHDKAGMQLAVHQSAAAQQRPFAAHASCHGVHGRVRREPAQQATVVSALQVFKTTLDGGATELSRVGRYLDTVKLEARARRSS